MKQHLHTFNNYATPASECLSEIDDLDKIEYDLDMENRSEFSNEDDKNMMLNFMQLRPMND